MHRKIMITVALVVGAFATSVVHASFARIESMGKNSTFVMDDISIFDNAANINIYPNYLIGEFGAYQSNDLEVGTNRDPANPWFGGIFSLALGKEDSRDPRLSIGGAFNRIDDKLFRFLPDSVKRDDPAPANVSRYITVPVPTPVTNFDGFLGGTLSNGNALGLHIYIAHQQGGVETSTGGYDVQSGTMASVVKLDGGVNWQLSTDIDMELSAGIARLQFGPEKYDLFDGDLVSGMVKGRLFSTWDLINGELVPAASYSFIQAPGIEEEDVAAGMGVNVALDRGFFWLGAEYIYNRARSHDWSYNDSTGKVIYYEHSGNIDWDVKESYGGRISFGIERNIWWDWFVIRVGGMKVLAYSECKHGADNNTFPNASSDYETLCSETGNYFYTNAGGDGSWGDHVGFGFGINVEEKLKVDATVAEDVIFRNPFQGGGRLLSRVSATYSF